MNSIELRYLASRKWMESEILSGRPVQRRDHTIGINLDDIDQELRDRVEAVTDAVFPIKVRKKLRTCVLDSGIDPELGIGPTEKALEPLDTPIVEAIGPLPELPEPTEDISAVVLAWEEWLGRYKNEALRVIEKITTDPPPVLRDLDPEEAEVEWGGVEIYFGDAVEIEVSPEAGPKAIRDSRAAYLWRWAASQRFSSESCDAAQEATDLTPLEAQNLLKGLTPEQLAEKFLQQERQLFQAAKAHDRARRAQVRDFESEMKHWANEKGSDRLRLGIADGYRMHSRYLAERLAAEAPGMFAMPANTAPEDWAYKASSPSEAALRLRRNIAAAMKRSAPANLDGKPEAEIMIVKKPPHGLFVADPGAKTPSGRVGVGLPSRDAWSWRVDAAGRPVDQGAKPFEAIVVKHWLGRYHLIGAVPDDVGGPEGIWAVPDLTLYEEDGTVHSLDPDTPAPNAAKRKPPEPPKEDDIPF